MILRDRHGGLEATQEMHVLFLIIGSGLLLLAQWSLLGAIVHRRLDLVQRVLVSSYLLAWRGME